MKRRAFTLVELVLAIFILGIGMISVAALFPAHEVEQFTELFFGRIGAWRADVAAGTA